MADTIKEAVTQAVEGVKNLAVSAEQKAAKPKKEKKAKGDGGDSRPLMLDPPPAYKPFYNHPKFHSATCI